MSLSLGYNSPDFQAWRQNKTCAASIESSTNMVTFINHHDRNDTQSIERRQYVVLSFSVISILLM